MSLLASMIDDAEGNLRQVHNSQDQEVIQFHSSPISKVHLLMLACLPPMEEMNNKKVLLDKCTTHT